MSRLFELLQAGENALAQGQYLMLYIVALLFLFLAKDEKNKTPASFLFRAYALCVFVLLLFPLTARALLAYQTVYYTYEQLWQMLPMTVVLAYTLVKVFYRMTHVMTSVYGRWNASFSKAKTALCECLMFLALAALLFLCGTLSPASDVTDKTKKTAPGQIPEAEGEALSCIASAIPDGGTVHLLAPNELMTWARIYDGRILLPYGRNMWEPELYRYSYEPCEEELVLLCGWINGTLPAPSDEAERRRQSEEYLRYCAAQGYDYILFDRDRIYGGGAEEEGPDDALLEALASQRVYVRCQGQTGAEEYVIYCRSGETYDG